MIDRAMTVEDWDAVRNFSPGEFSGPMSRALILQLDAWREYLGRAVRVTSSGRAADRSSQGSSQHDTNPVRAVDVAPVGGSIIEAYLSAERFDWPGLGLYYNPAFLHLDVREAPAGRGSRWARWGPQGTPYRTLDAEFLEAVQVAERTRLAGQVAVGFSSALLGGLVVVMVLRGIDT